MDAGEALREVWGDLLQDRGGEQEIARFIRLLIEDLLCQEGEEVAVSRRCDRSDECASIVGVQALTE